MVNRQGWEGKAEERVGRGPTYLKETWKNPMETYFVSSLQNTILKRVDGAILHGGIVLLLETMLVNRNFSARCGIAPFELLIRGVPEDAPCQTI